MYRLTDAAPILRLRDEMDRLFGSVLSHVPFEEQLRGFGRGVFPAVNIWEDREALYAEAELPGVKMDDLKLFVAGNELTIQGERSVAVGENQTFHRRERGIGQFSRVVRLPVEINADNVQATLRDGVLTITLPKAQAARPRKIEVKA